MKLQLTYQATSDHEIQAMFLSSPHVSDWLAELSRWNIPLRDMELYPVPTSLSKLSAVGLFVVFKTPNIPSASPLASAYYCLGQSLFVPMEASLAPQVLDSEWKDLLLYDRNLFHPRIGLIGFSTDDQLALKNLIYPPELIINHWQNAQTGLSTRPPLRSIKLNKSPFSEFLSSLQQELDTRPLNQIPDKDKDLESESPLSKGLRSLGDFLSKKLREATQDNTSKSGRSNQGEGDGTSATGSSGQGPLGNWMDKARAWANRKWQDLDKKREREMQKLLRMLDEDPDEALRYSIPLEGLFKGRGTAPPSGNLGRRNPNFDLNQLRGGGRADYWNVNKHYHTLREKYQRTAKEKLKSGDFRKAAYIYAHLLGDLHSAASALKQGKHYREAAVLYQEHLKKPAQAATCLEEGGFLLEAIEIFEELGQHLKVADLYTAIGQEDKAVAFYEKAAHQSLKSGNYVGAYHIYREKLKSPIRAKKLLLEGWKSSKQPEQCLLLYLEQYYEEEGTEALEEQLNLIYQNHVPANKRKEFVSILILLNQKKEPEEPWGQDIAYEIISEQVIMGQTELLPNLQNFVAQDRILSQDVSRFLYHKKSSHKKHNPNTKAVQLDASIKWKSAFAHQSSLVVLGVKSGELHLARISWKGRIVYTSSPGPIPGEVAFEFLESTTQTNEIWILSSKPLPLDSIELPGGFGMDFRYPLKVSFPNWVPKEAVRICRGKGLRPSALVVRNDQVQCIHYDNDGEVVSTYDCMIKDQALNWKGDQSLRPMYFRDFYFYTFMQGDLLRISMRGRTEVVRGAELIRSLAISSRSTAKRFVINKGRYLTGFQPNYAILDAERTMLRNRINEVQHLVFLGSRQLVILGKTAGEVYDLKEHRIMYRFACKNNIVAVTTAASRREFALIHLNGLILIEEAPPI